MPLRDRATKALVSLLTKRIPVLRRVIGSFLQVNDPYILERLFAVAYGCAMRSTDNEAIGKLAKDVYEWIFKNGRPIPHILLRDYARGVIELALQRRVEIEIDVEKIRPPYKSEWPSFAIPAEEELKGYGERQEGMPDEERSRVYLYESVFGFSDFARYIIGTNYNNFEWSSSRLGEPEERSADEYRFDLSIAQRWIFKKVLNLGWTTERFGRFDENLVRYSSFGRSGHKAERIGKKYQWIAFHEFLARVSDNFVFRASDEDKKYEGPWQIRRRDIDPSCLKKKTGMQDELSQTNTWWFPVSYDAWESEPDDTVWLKNDKDLPSLEQLLEVSHPKDNSRWFVLNASYEWQPPIPPGEESYLLKHREMSFRLDSYIVRRSDIDELYQWLESQGFGSCLPESSELIRVFLGEFFWAPAFQYHNTPYHSHYGWTKGHSNELPYDVLVSTDIYLQERSGLDCSIDDSIHIRLPAKWLTDNMKLQWQGIEGQFHNEKGELIAFDPSVTSVGPGTLLIKRDAFLKFLDDNGLPSLE